MVRRASLFIGASVVALAAWYFGTNKQGIKPMKEIVSETVKQAASYTLEELPIIEAEGSDVTAYFLFDKHYRMREETNPDKTALDCHVQVYKQLEQLYKSGQIGLALFEGTYKGKGVLDEIKERVKNYDESVPAQLEGTATSLVDQDITAFIQQDTGDAKNAFAINYAGHIPSLGWENTAEAELDEEHRAFFERMKRLQETEQKIQRREIRKGSPEYSAYIQEDRSFAEDLEANRERRSKEAYETSFALANTWHVEHPDKSQNYAVVIGNRHKDDILEIIATQEIHPKVVAYACP